MVSFLFWNLMKNNLQTRLARVVARHGIDVILLAECDMDPVAVAARLTASDGSRYASLPCESRKIKVISRLPAAALVEKYTDDGIGLHVRELRPQRSPRVFIAAIHFPSKAHWSEQEQEHGVMSRLLPAVLGQERRGRHQRTVLVGDLNMNPFDPGVTSAFALHAVMTKALARREDRDVAGNPYRFFYNPMWGHFGDRSPGPPGTYYHRSSKPGNFFWNVYDQVLLRPALMDNLSRLEVLDNDGTESLLTRSGLPAIAAASDHLPILFTLDL